MLTSVDLEYDAPFVEGGIDSLSSMEFVNTLRQQFGITM
jgi:acyl carrier protein